MGTVFHLEEPSVTYPGVLNTGSKALIGRDGSHQVLSAGPASLAPGALAAGSRGHRSPDGEQLASKTACQMWPAGLAAGYPGQRSPIQSGQGLVPRTGMCLAGLGGSVPK